MLYVINCLGNNDIIAQPLCTLQSEKIPEISKVNRRSLALTLLEYQTNYKDRNKAMAQAYGSGVFSMAHIANRFGVHYMTVRRAVKRFEDRNL
ncbi:MAG: hypothetical protein K0R08_962 [Solimicrobium sp.]|jgi:hypothetical protein|nr:hypothetical protein [Solimicrobium sp.]